MGLSVRVFVRGPRCWWPWATRLRVSSCLPVFGHLRARSRGPSVRACACARIAGGAVASCIPWLTHGFSHVASSFRDLRAPGEGGGVARRSEPPPRRSAVRGGDRRWLLLGSPGLCPQSSSCWVPRGS